MKSEIRKMIMLLILTTFLLLICTTAFSYDGYDYEKCTAVVGKNTVQLEFLEFNGKKYCNNSDSTDRYVPVKKEGRWNIYDKERKRFLLDKWSIYEQRAANHTYTKHKPKTVMVNYDDKSTNESVRNVVDNKTGKILFIFKDVNQFDGPIGNDELYALIPKNDACKLIKVNGVNKFKEIFKTDYTNCILYYLTTEYIVFENKSTGEYYKHSLSNMNSTPQYFRDYQSVLSIHRKSSYQVRSGGYKLNSQVRNSSGELVTNVDCDDGGHASAYRMKHDYNSIGYASGGFNGGLNGQTAVGISIEEALQKACKGE